MPNHYIKLLTKYDGSKGTSAEEPMDHFQEFTDNIFVDNDDVYMSLFAQYLEGDV